MLQLFIIMASRVTPLQLALCSESSLNFGYYDGNSCCFKEEDHEA